MHTVLDLGPNALGFHACSYQKTDHGQPCGLRLATAWGSDDTALPVDGCGMWTQDGLSAEKKRNSCLPKIAALLLGLLVAT